MTKFKVGDVIRCSKEAISKYWGNNPDIIYRRLSVVGVDTNSRGRLWCSGWYNLLVVESKGSLTVGHAFEEWISSIDALYELDYNNE